ncbi:hypothetical protein EXN66_Car006210 [Channa argus]|uniref:Ig-like domain-containing protein n=1 Tax=Channa argus TaxID=215402 RepID=A0A6G1PJX9_CHAAH|nr:hypothetical protein EXN66_Car006210 [Channa argus]KAK2908255.1 hypothetical protein Q8A73_009328 [Channa argus]
MRKVNLHRGQLQDLHSQHFLRKRRDQIFRMDATVTLIVVLGWWSVGSVCLSAPSGSYFMVFSSGTLLVVKADEPAQCDKADEHHHQNEATGSFVAPSIQILSSVPLSQDPGSPHFMVCLLTGLNSPVQDILWWVDDTMVTSADAAVSLMTSDKDGAYSATSVWAVSAANWRSRSTYWCGTVQEGQVYRQRSC